MSTVIIWPGRRHARASASSGLTNAAAGTSPPDNALKRTASFKDGSLRPAKMLRRCDSEQSASTAKLLRDFCRDSAHRSIGCDSLMPETISGRNDSCQSEIFLGEMRALDNPPLKSSMAKRNAPPPREIYLGEWLQRAELGPTKAAEIAGCSQSYISNIMRGEKPNINVLYLLRLSEEIGISVNDFFRKPPSDSQLASLADLSPEAQEMLLRKRQARR
ncbi:helix-turn-helix domain-containing protein (plasmid) [Bradyrhizobium oligotrophicum S58]